MSRGRKGEKNGHPSRREGGREEEIWSHHIGLEHPGREVVLNEESLKTSEVGGGI